MSLVLWAVVVLLLVIPGAWVLAPLWRTVASDSSSAERPRMEMAASLLVRREELAMLLADLELDHRDGRLDAATYDELRHQIADIEAAHWAGLEPPPAGQP